MIPAPRPHPAHIVFLLILLLGITAAHAQDRRDVVVLRSDAREIILKITPRVSFDTVAGGLMLPRVARAIVANDTATGAPVELELSIPLIVPGPSGAELEVLGMESAPAVTGRIAPVPTAIRGPDGLPQPRYVVDAASYAAATPGAPGAELRYLGIAREVHVASVVVRPVAADVGSNLIQSIQSITVRVRYGSIAQGRGPRSPLSEVSRAALINAANATEWTISATPAPLARRSAVAAARAWIKVDVKEDGLQVLTAEDFQKAGVDLTTVDPSRVAIYGGNGGDLTESVQGISGDHLHQVPAIVERGSNGRVERVLFYGVGPSRWGYPGFDTLPVHRVSPYVTANSYIVAIDGEETRAFPWRSGPGEFTMDLDRGTSRLFFEEDKVNAIDIRRVGSGSSKAWWGTEFIVDPRDRPTDLRAFPMTLPGLDRTGPVVYRFRMANAVASKGRFTLWQQDTRIGEITVSDASEYVPSVAASRVFFFPDASAVPSDNRSSLKIEFSSDVAGSGFLDYYEIHYTRRLVAENGSITFDAPLDQNRAGSIARFRVTGFASDDLLGFDVTDAANPVQLERKPSGEFGVFVFHDELQGPQKGRRYFIVERTATRRVASVAKAPFGDLRGRARNTDIVVITHDDLKGAAQKYVDYRNSRGALRASFVTTSEIYTEYSHGNLDPTAIRNFLGEAYRTWSTRPQYVILLGDGNYDYRNIVTIQKQLVPTSQSPDNDVYNENFSVATDDYFLRLTNDRLPDIVSGRWPAETAEQANVMVDKLIRYETATNFGAWRHTIILASDDNLPPPGDGFVNQSESIARYIIDEPATYDFRKVYLPIYPTERITTDRKPGATADLLQFVERGAIALNFIGHGNPKQWAHELLLERDLFIPRLTNDSMLTYVTAATCNFGLFDDPSQVSGAELFLLHPTGGAVAVMSSTRASFIGDNEDLIGTYYEELFQRDSTTHSWPSIGAALLVTKLMGNGRPNDLKFHILGDPSMRLNVPRDIATIDSINGRLVGDSIITLPALSIVRVSGTVLDAAGSLASDFSGTAIVSLYDADRRTTVMDGQWPVTMEFSGGRLFRGPVQVVNGRYTATFRVPKDIAFDSAAARLHVYAYNETRDAVAAERRLRVFGTDTVTVSDSIGPVLTIFLDDRSFRSGDIVTPEPLLIVDLNDTSGVNSSGSSLGHRIEAWVDGSPNSIDLTELYQTSGLDYRSGSAERILLGLSPGNHTVRVRAWDIFNNPAERTALFRISEGGADRLVVSNVVNFPNPMAGETEFTFGHNQSRPLDVEVAIFTAAGRRIRTLEARGVQERFVRVRWDGTDLDGVPVGNGVYLYRLRVSVVGDEDAGSFESIEKVAVVR